MDMVLDVFMLMVQLVILEDKNKDNDSTNWTEQDQVTGRRPEISALLEGRNIAEGGKIKASS